MQKFFKVDGIHEVEGLSTLRAGMLLFSDRAREKKILSRERVCFNSVKEMTYDPIEATDN